MQKNLLKIITFILISIASASAISHVPLITTSNSTVGNAEIEPPALPILSNNLRQSLINKQFSIYENGEPYNSDDIYKFAIQYAIGLAQAGNTVAAEWLNTTMQNSLLRIDPVWGGMYSTINDAQPNYEKALSVQANFIPVILQTYTISGSKEYLTAANSIINYMQTFLMSPDGAFYHMQAAKMKAGKQDAAYYKLDAKERSQLGIPEVDKSIYADDNGLAISALLFMHRTTGDEKYLNQAIKSANWVVNLLGTPDGGFRHSQEDNDGIALRDNIFMARAFLMLYSNTTEHQYLLRAERILDYINSNFQHPSGAPGFVAFVPNNINENTRYQINAGENTNLARVAAMAYSYTGDKKYLMMAQRCLQYLVLPTVVNHNIPAMTLIANNVITSHPLNITVIGKKDDPVAVELFTTALKFPSFYITFHWYTSAKEASKASGLAYPTLPKAAAFFCANGSCSLPLYNASQFNNIAKKLLLQQGSEHPVKQAANNSSEVPGYSFLHAQKFFSDTLLSHRWGLIILIFWAAGLLLAFTPCVFPVLLVLSSLLMSSSGIVTHRRMFFLTLTYILSLATTYALLGYAAGELGIYLQVYMQSPLILILMSLLLTVLSFSLLGGYSLKLPPSIQHYLISFNSFRASNTYIGAALMGMALTLIASPCAAAPLIGVLSIMTKTGDPMFGIIALFSMGIGIGTPLFFAWLAREQALPKVEAWQKELQTFFGLIILAVAIWMSARVIPETIYMSLLSGLAIVTALYMGLLNPMIESAFGKFWKTASIMMFVYGLGLMVGALLGNQSPYMPLAVNKNVLQPYNAASVGIFQTVKTQAELDALLATSQNQNRQLLLDFYAAWCGSCKEIETNVFINPEVAKLMLNFTLVRVDLSDRDTDTMSLANKYNVLAPPAIIFFDNDGAELDIRIDGEVTVEEFTQTLRKVLEMKKPIQ